MSDTYTYKVRDRSGNLINGSLIADSESLVLHRVPLPGAVLRFREAE